MPGDSFNDPEQARLLDQACDRYERDWKAGRNPNIQEYLTSAPGPERNSILTQLLLIDWEMHSDAGTQPELSKYLLQFPDDGDVLELAWAEYLRQSRQDDASGNDPFGVTAGGPDVTDPQATRNESIPGSLGRYRVQRLLGRGSFGRVFLAHDESLRRDVAIKVPNLHVLQEGQQRDTFIAEARTLAELDHPHIVPVYDVGSTAGYPCYVVSKYMDGPDLANLVRTERPSFRESAMLVASVAEALQFAHAKKIVHRDIKPANILLDSSGRPHVADFGLALNAEQYGQGAGLVGTPSYMSPEQVSHEGHLVDGRSDIFSLGVVFYELLTGERPFSAHDVPTLLERIASVEARPPRQLDPSIPQPLEKVCLKALSKRPVDRYTTAGDLVAELNDWLGETKQAVSTGLAMSLSARNPIPQTPTAAEVRSSDIVISSAELDNQSIGANDTGWVSRFEQNLKVRMEQLLGERVQVASLPMSSNVASADDTLVESIGAAKTLVSVLSPPFTKSPGCLASVKQFWSSAEESGNLTIEDRPRIFKVLKSPIPQEDVPRELQSIFSRLFGFEFYERDSETGRVREFDELLGPTMKQRFHERVYDLAHDVSQLLRAYRRISRKDESSGVDASTRPVVYLATTTTDIQDDRDRMRRELIERGCVVVPDAALPLSAKELERSITTCLKKCTMAVHLLGRHYGVTPEDGEESLPAMQLRLSSRYADSNTLTRFLWMPPSHEQVNQRQQKFLDEVRNSPTLHGGAELIEGELTLLKSIVIRRLAESQDRESPKVIAPRSGGPPRLYLICDRRDEESVAGLEDYLFEQGLEVCLPAFDGSDFEALALHRENLATCDALMVYYGGSPRAWVDIKLRDVLKAPGYGRAKSIDLQAVYVALPDDTRKQRFKSLQATVIRAGESLVDNQVLNEFITAVRQSTG